MSRLAIVLSFVVLAACSREDRRAAPAPAAAPPALAHATQEDLRRELDDANRRGTWRELRTRWQGQTLRWTVTRFRTLCTSAEACNVAAFPVKRPAQQGWMPLVDFAPGGYAALESTCGTRDTCEVTLEATLAELDVSGEHATRVRLAGARVVTGT